MRQQFVKQAVIVFRYAGYAMLEQPGADPVGGGFADKPQRILRQPAIGSAFGIIEPVLVLYQRP